MKKPFLLIAGDHYYPSRGTDDWVACFETSEEAESVVSKNAKDHVWGGTYDQFCIRGSFKDWYEIVDLRNWTEDDKRDESDEDRLIDED